MKELFRSDFRLGRRSESGRMFGAKDCEGGCGKTVSAHRRQCLDCLRSGVKDLLTEKGIEASEEEVSRGLLQHIA